MLAQRTRKKTVDKQLCRTISNLAPTAPCAAEKFVLPNGSPACHADPGEGKQNSGHEKDFVD
jgi:hypothetical protein